MLLGHTHQQGFQLRIKLGAARSFPLVVEEGEEGLTLAEQFYAMTA